MVTTNKFTLLFASLRISSLIMKTVKNRRNALIEGYEIELDDQNRTGIEPGTSHFFYNI